MPKKPQNFANHMRWFPLYHFVASPLCGLYAIYAIVLAMRTPSAASVIHAAWAIGISTAVLSSRIMALAVQDRLIRLEMRLRLREVLPGPLAARISELRTKQLIALRFASDAELPALVERTLGGEFATQREIKRAVTDWQPDYVRA